MFPFNACLASSYLVLYCLVLSGCGLGLGLSCLILFHLAVVLSLSCFTLYCIVLSCHVWYVLVLCFLVLPSLVLSRFGIASPWYHRALSCVVLCCLDL